jgi:hypothetical protein
VLRLGNETLNAHTAAPGTALPLYWDSLDSAGTVRRTVAVPPSGGDACTLSFGSGRDGATDWWLDAEGLPSMATETRDAILLPCHGSPAGAPLAALLADTKAIAVLDVAGDVTIAARFAGFTGVRGTATGLRQAATGGSRDEFWLAGIAATDYGVRYVGPRSAGNASAAARPPLAHVHGAHFYATGPLPHYQPATLDVRGLHVAGSQLLLTSSYVAEPNRDMPHTDDVWAEHTAWGGVVRVRRPAGAAGVPREAAGSRPRLLAGFTGRRNLWAFVSEHPRSLWVVLDRARYTPANASGAAAWQAAMRAHTPDVASGPQGGPVLARASPRTALVNWRWVDWRWVEAPAAEWTQIADACHSLSGRVERGAWTLYTASRTRVYRAVPGARAVSVLAEAPPGALYRGVSIALPPLPPPPPGTAAASAPPAPSTTARPRSRSPKPRG